MNENQIKSAWQSTDSKLDKTSELRDMLKEKKHPVLRRLRRQMIIETVAFSIFLFVYYDFFDGHQKPFLANLLLATAVCFAITHNILVYMNSKRRQVGDNLIQSLDKQATNIKRQAALSIIIRLIAAACLLFFFTTTITFDTTKYTILAGLLSVFLIQICLLIRVWSQRVRSIRSTITQLSAFPEQYI